MSPLVSIIVPTYNSASYIKDALVSIINQTYQNWECIIIDDGSTDQTKEIVEPILISDDRFIYHYQVNQGLSKSRNIGIYLAKGEYIQFLDSDDVLFPEKLSISIEQYQKDGSNKVVYFTDFHFTKDKNPYELNDSIRKHYNNINDLLPIQFDRLYQEWDKSFIIPTHSFLLPVKIFGKIRYDERLKSKEDWDFYLTILKNETISFNSINYLGAGYRVSNQAMSRNNTVMVAYSFIVLYKWRKKYIKYLIRSSDYLFYFYYKRIRGGQGSMSVILREFKKYNTKALLDLVLMHLFLPLSFLSKLNSHL